MAGHVEHRVRVGAPRGKPAAADDVHLRATRARTCTLPKPCMRSRSKRACCPHMLNSTESLPRCDKLVHGNRCLSRQVQCETNCKGRDTRDARSSRSPDRLAQ
eukprot:4640687-Pleurochrysis_carterae.AAC.2